MHGGDQSAQLHPGRRLGGDRPRRHRLERKGARCGALADAMHRPTSVRAPVHFAPGFRSRSLHADGIVPFNDLSIARAIHDTQARRRHHWPGMPASVRNARAECERRATRARPRHVQAECLYQLLPRACDVAPTQSARTQRFGEPCSRRVQTAWVPPCGSPCVTA